MTIGYALPALYLYAKGTRYNTDVLGECSENYCLWVDQHSMYNE